jgi:hypothetical protein
MGCVMHHTTLAELQHAESLPVRRVLERLREGLYDPLAVRLLTAHHEALDARIEADLQHLEAGVAAHLCVCGAYGQGKSHTLTYLRERGLERGYMVSSVNLDPRQAPLHQFRQVYRALLENLTLPGGADGAASHTSLIAAWQAWARAQVLPAMDPSTALAALLPADMPHPFKAILVALAQTTVPIPAERRTLQQYRDYQPAIFPTTLQRALRGEAVPVLRLRPALKYRQVPFYRQESLALTGDEPFLRMLQTLPQLAQRLGYKGWMLLFDEAEAMIQVRAPLRARSYRILHQLLFPQVASPGLYPVFACTPDFFQQLHAEDYSLAYFDRDYAAAWKALSIYQLRSLSRQAWQELCATLMTLHALAYRWSPDQGRLLPRLLACLPSLPLQDTRATLKALVDELDHVHQQEFFAHTTSL